MDIGAVLERERDPATPPWRTVRFYVGLAGLLASALALCLSLSKCDTGRPGSPFTRVVFTTSARQAEVQCSKAYGDCQVTEFIHVREDGSQWVETCFASVPVTEGHGSVRVAVSYCYKP